MKTIFKKFFILQAIITLVFLPFSVFAQDTINLQANNLLLKSEIFITPRQSTFLVGSTFEAPIYIDTKGNSINAVNLDINFDPNKLSIVNPSGGKSIFGIWVEPPVYDNKKGTASLAGVVPGGIVTSSGLIVTITFKVLSAGNTQVSINNQSSVNLNDGLGSEVLLTRGSANYILNNRPPDGALIYSETHPSSDSWYNNNSPVFTWDTKEGANGYSVLFDHTPMSIPPSVITNTDAMQYYENINDGIWYFHLKQQVKGVWGPGSHFQVRIDTQPPADFDPKVNSFKDESGKTRYMVSFFTTDTMSGVDRYEVGVISKSVDSGNSPVFIQTESPFLVPNDISESSRVLIRAYDKAGNVLERFVDIYPGVDTVNKLKKIGVYVLIGLIVILLLELIFHYLLGHHAWEHFRKAYKVFRNISDEEEPPKPPDY